MHVLQRLAQPQMAPVLDDSFTRLSALFTVLSGAGLFTLHHYNIVTARTLLRLAIVFEVVVAFSLAMVETSRPFNAATPLLGLSEVGAWILFVAAVIPRSPGARLWIGIAAATTWPLAYWINSMRLGFVTESWRQTSIWPLMNYLFAVLAHLLARWTYGTSAGTPTPRELGSYQLMWPIGEGGMGEVWRASHNMLARPAAIKIVKFDAGREELFARRFHREANAIAGLQSPHTVYLYDFGTTQEGRLYYVMELLDGISLQTLITTFGPQPAPRVVAILRQICRSLEEAHEKQIVHRDLKPSNVMICQVAQTCDFVKVLDFGLAKPFGTAEPSNLTVEGVTLGTPEYMAPEVARASSSVDARADLYALGCVAYVLLTGSLVFTDANPVNVALKHMKAAPVPPSQRTGQSVPADLERVILACLEKNPGARPSSARDVERLLAACRVPPWDDEQAGAWWARHLPPTSPLRSFSQSQPHTPPVVQKA
jgi:eukaryotic-like serine/threonine-protein kinase